ECNSRRRRRQISGGLPAGYGNPSGAIPGQYYQSVSNPNAGHYGTINNLNPSGNNLVYPHHKQSYGANHYGSNHNLLPGNNAYGSSSWQNNNRPGSNGWYSGGIGGNNIYPYNNNYPNSNLYINGYFNNCCDNLIYLIKFETGKTIVLRQPLKINSSIELSTSSFRLNSNGSMPYYPMHRIEHQAWILDLLNHHQHIKHFVPELLILNPLKNYLIESYIP
ncbi:unnamed protein product, partial [Didymodactylos carnosus]